MQDNPGERRSTFRQSLRGRFLIAVGFALSIMLASGVAHVAAMHSAHKAAVGAQRSKDRAAVYTGLSQVMTDMHMAALAPNRRTSLGKSFEDSEKEFKRLLRRMAQLPADAHEQRADAMIARRAAVYIAIVNDRPALVNRIGLLIHGRSDNYGAQMEALFGPVIGLQRALQAETARNDRKLTQALDRSAILSARLAALSAILLLAGLLVISLSAALFLRRLRHGLKALEDGATAVASGDLEHRIGLVGRDELANLARSFDSMAHELRSKQNELDRTHQALENIVAVRTRELRHANAELAEGDNRRRRFLADIGHELRTPLTIIRGESQIWLRTAQSDPRDAEPTFERILHQTDLLIRLVNDLFLIARAEAGGLPLVRETSQLETIAQRLVADFAVIAEDRGVVMRFRENSSSRPCSVDAQRIQQLIAILLDNSVRHGGPHGTVEVWTAEEGDWQALYVADTGPGVPAHLRHNLFGRFYRGEHKAEGSGLGLAVAQALALAHGGTLTLEPTEAGATFALRIPSLTMQSERAA